MTDIPVRDLPPVARWCSEWLNLTWMLYGWWAREHHLNMQAIGLPSWPATGDAGQLQRPCSAGGS